MGITRQRKAWRCARRTSRYHAASGTIAVILVGWGMTWANQNAKINSNRTKIDMLSSQVDSDSVSIAFDVTLEYNTPYAFRFWMDLETHAEAIPEPGTLLLLGLGSLALAGKRKT